MKVKIRDINELQRFRYCKSKSGDKKCKNCLLYPICSFERLNWFGKFMHLEESKKFFSNEYLNQEIEIKVDKPKPSKEVIAILKLFNKKWKYITKDSDGIITVYERKPAKQLASWDTYYGDSICIDILFNIKDKLWDFLSWEDEEPTNIEELIKEYENGDS